VAAESWRPPPARLTLERDDVHVWCVSTAREHASSCLSPDELARAERFHFERDRCAFVVVRGVLRLLLGRYLSRSPEQLRFGERARGKPYLIGEPVQFNVSHSGELGLLAFARSREVGIDVERADPTRDLLGLAEGSFVAEETAVLRTLPSADRASAFYTCWARKEAFIKATGEGVAQLAAVEVTLRPGEPARLVRAPGGLWSIHDLPACHGYASALVVHGEGPRLSCWRWDG